MDQFSFRSRFFVLVLSLVGSFSALAEPIDAVLPRNEKSELSELPLFEIGIGVVSAWIPDYPGASEGRMFTLPAPTFRYRGEILRNDDEGGLRGAFLDSSRYEFSISVGANLPVNSDDNEARAGMDDLGFIFQFGPRLRYFLLKDDQTEFYLDFALRPGFSVAQTWRAWRGVGFVASPEIGYQYRWSRYRAFTGLSLNVGSYELHKYFYDVKSKDVATERPYYRSRSGYFSTSFFSGITIQVAKRFRMFVAGQAISLVGNVNRKSPLMKDETNYTGAIGLFYDFYESERRAIRKK